MKTRVAAIAAVVGLVVCSLAAAGSATAPGKNGRIAFTRYFTGSASAPGGGTIFTAAANGKAERRVVARPPAGASDLQPDWSPDGSRIVFERRHLHNDGEIYSVKADGTGLKLVDPGCPPGIPDDQICQESAPAWSPNGKQIAFEQEYGKLKTIRGEQWEEVGAIAVMNPDGSKRRQVTQRHRPTSSEDGHPVWSPDGTRIAFERENSTALPLGGSAIFVVNADGTGLRQVTPWKLRAGDHPDWSPDGSRILFRSPSDEFAGSSLYTIRVNGTGLKRLTRFPSSTEVLSASYSPDGKWIVFSRTGKGGLPDLYVMRSDGRVIRQVTRTSRWESAPDWGPR